MAYCIMGNQVSQIVLLIVAVDSECCSQHADWFSPTVHLFVGELGSTKVLRDL